MGLLELERGTQILYVPTHANGRLNHPNVEEGFVTSVQGIRVFCRYWSKDESGALCTKDNSELTAITNLVIRKSHLQSDVEYWLSIIDAEERQ